MLYGGVKGHSRQASGSRAVPIAVAVATDFGAVASPPRDPAKPSEHFLDPQETDVGGFFTLTPGFLLRLLQGCMSYQPVNQRLDTDWMEVSSAAFSLQTAFAERDTAGSSRDKSNLGPAVPGEVHRNGLQS